MDAANIALDDIRRYFAEWQKQYNCASNVLTIYLNEN